MFAGQAAGVLRPALRIPELKDTVENLHAALASRTVIDTAVGVVMAQNHCDRDAAFAILVRAAGSRNVMLDVAAAVVCSVSKEQLTVYFDPLTLPSTPRAHPALFRQDQSLCMPARPKVDP